MASSTIDCPGHKNADPFPVGAKLIFTNCPFSVETSLSGERIQPSTTQLVPNPTHTNGGNNKHTEQVSREVRWCEVLQGFRGEVLGVEGVQ